METKPDEKVNKLFNLNSHKQKSKKKQTKLSKMNQMKL